MFVDSVLKNFDTPRLLTTMPSSRNKFVIVWGLVSAKMEVFVGSSVSCSCCRPSYVHVAQCLACIGIHCIACFSFGTFIF